MLNKTNILCTIKFSHKTGDGLANTSTTTVKYTVGHHSGAQQIALESKSVELPLLDSRLESPPSVV